MQVGREIDPLFSQPELFPDVVAVRVDGALGDVQMLGDLLGRLAVPDEVGHLDFLRCEVEHPRRELPGEGGNDALEARLDGVDLRFIPGAGQALLQFCQVRQDAILDVRRDSLLRLFPILLPALQENLQCSIY